MIIIKVKGKKDIDRALKSLKYKFKKFGIMDDIKENEEFTKKSVKKRKKKLKATYVQKKRNEADE